MSKKTKISRETIVAIEGEDPKIIKALKLQIILNWQTVCDPLNMHSATKGFRSFFKKAFSIT